MKTLFSKTPLSKTLLSKTALALVFAATALTSMSTLAHDDAQKHCYPLPNGEDGMGSSNSIHMPFMHTGGKWQSRIYVTNTSDKNLNVKATLRTNDGEVYTPVQYSMIGAFSPTNSPFDHLVGGAILKPLKSAEIHIYDNNFHESFTGKVTWQADACLESAMTGAYRAFYSTTSRFDQGLTVFNGGNPF